MIARRSLLLISLASILLTMGCGSSSLKRGDRLGVLEEIRVNGESVWEDGTTEAFTTQVPKGTVFEVMYPQREGLDIVEVRPVRVPGVQGEDAIVRYFLPPHLHPRLDYGFKSFSVTVNANDIGTKIKRLDEEQ